MSRTAGVLRKIVGMVLIIFSVLLGVVLGVYILHRILTAADDGDGLAILGWLVIAAVLYGVPIGISDFVQSRPTANAEEHTDDQH